MKKVNDRFLLKLWLSYSIILIFVLIMGIYMYYVGIQSARNHLVNTNYTTLKNSVSDVEDSLQIIHSLNTQVTTNSNLFKIMRTKEATTSNFFLDIVEANKYLTNLLPMQNITFVDNFYIYLHNTDYVLSANVLESSYLYYHYSKRYQNTYYDEYMDLITNPVHSDKILELEKFPTTKLESFLLYVLPASKYHLGSSIPASFCYEINVNKFKSIFSPISLYGTGSIYITDEAGDHIITITDEESIPVDIDLLNSLRSDDSTNQPQTIEVNDNNMLVTTITSTKNHWTYHLIQPESMALQDLETVQKTYTSIIIITILFGAVAIFVLSNKNYKPFILLESRLKDSLDEDELNSIDKKSLAYSLDTYIDGLIKRKDSLQETLEHQRPIIYSSYLARIMNEIIENKEELSSISNSLNLNPNAQHIILSLTIYLDGLSFYVDDYKKNSSDDYKELIKETIYRVYGNNLHIYEADHHTFALIIQCDSEDYNSTSVRTYFEELQNQLKTDFNIIIFGATSNPYQDLSFTWQAYQQAIESLNYTAPDNNFQEYDNIKRMNDSYHYPNELSQQLINAIHSGKEKQVSEILKYIYNENFIERSLSITMIKWLISDLRNSLLKARFLIPSDADTAPIIKIDELLQGKKSFILIENLALEICKFFEPKNTSNSLISNIKLFIKENYKDSSLSLNKISDTFNISESYFSHLFKEETKENFSEYLEKLRIDQAMKLLKSTDMSIVDIASDVGYNSALSFRRAFKKLHGITPIATRNISKQITEIAVSKDFTE